MGRRELEVLEGLLDGVTEAEIGERLGISPHTVHSHTRSIYLKLGVHNRVELFRKLVLTNDG